MTTFTFPSTEQYSIFEHWFIKTESGIYLAFLVGLISSACTFAINKFLFRKYPSKAQSNFILMSWPFLAIQILFLIQWLPNHGFGQNFGWHPMLLLGTGLGWIDDRWALSGKIKLPVLALIWTGLCVYFGFQLGCWWSPTSIIVVYSLFGFFALVAIPLIDGINGLMIGYLIICAITGSISMYINFLTIVSPFNAPLHYVSPWALFGEMDNIIVLLVLAALLLGTLVWNFPKGRLRLGEMAILPLAMFLSHQLIAAGITWKGQPILGGCLGSMSSRISPMAWILLCYPILDMTMVFAWRISRRRSPFLGGHDHLHHRLIQSGWSSTATAIAILSAVAFLAVAVIADDIASLAHLRTLLVVPEIKDVHLLRFIWVGALPLLYLFWRGYTKVNPYKSGAVDERGRP